MYISFLFIPAADITLVILMKQIIDYSWEYSELSVESNHRGDIDHFWDVISVYTAR